MNTTDAVPVHPSNEGARRAWDGDDGAYWAEHEATFDASLGRYHERFLAAARIEPTDRILDIGCGNGQTTRDAARRARQGSALGVDLSAAMIERARGRAAEEGLTNVGFLQADAQIHPFGAGEFDVAISRTGAMFFGDPVLAFTNIARALCPGGRLALLTWQPLSGNHWIRDFMHALAVGRDLPAPPPDAPGPFALSDADRVRALLTASGFTHIMLDGAEELMYFGESVESAYRFVRGLGFTTFMLDGLGADDRRRALDALRSTIEAHATADGVRYPSAAWIVTART